MPSRYETCWLESVSSRLALLEHFSCSSPVGKPGAPGRLNFTATTCQGSQETSEHLPSSRTHLLRHNGQSHVLPLTDCEAGHRGRDPPGSNDVEVLDSWAIQPTAMIALPDWALECDMPTRLI